MASGDPGKRHVPDNTAVDMQFDSETNNSVQDIFKLADDMENKAIK